MNDQRQTSPYDAAIDDLRAKREAIDRAIEFLESLRDGSFVGSAAIPQFIAPSQSINAATPSVEILPGTFHGMSVAEATKKLLLLRKRTLTAQQIATDLQAGGLLNSATTITSVLHRAFASGTGDVVRVTRGQWGLQEWYPTRRFSRKTSED